MSCITVHEYLALKTENIEYFQRLGIMDTQSQSLPSRDLVPDSQVC